MGMTGLTERDQGRWIVSYVDLILVELRERSNMMYSRRISEFFFATATPLTGSVISL
jgi:hypothetical protein